MFAITCEVRVPYCPNPDCSYRKRFRESAEFRTGTTVCSDCQSPLSEDDVLGPPGPSETPSNPFALSELHKRLLWTLALMAFWRIISHAPVPGLHLDELSKVIPGLTSSFPSAVFSLGLLPYVVSYMLVEILALFVRPLKRWREEDGSAGRARLFQTARWLTLFVAFAWAISAVATMAQLDPVFIDKAPLSLTIMVITLVAGTFLSLWIADMISAKGVGHGISILTLTSIAVGLPYGIVRLESARNGLPAVRFFGLPLLTIIGVIVVIVLVERAHKKMPIRFANGFSAELPVKLTTAGTVPSSWAVSLLSLPIVVIGNFDPGYQASHQKTWQWIVENSNPSSPVWIAASCLLILVLYQVFTRLFFRTGTIQRYLHERTSAIIPEGAVETLTRNLRYQSILGAVYLTFISISLTAVWLLGDIPLAVQGTTLIVAVALDLANEIQARRKHGPLVKIAEHQEPWKAGLVRSLLEPAEYSRCVPGISLSLPPVFLRAFYRDIDLCAGG